MVLKIIGIGVKEYFKGGFNLYDSIIILISTLDIILNSAVHNQTASGLSVLRGLRILRLLKIAKSH
jgi:hypothetical protein